MFMNESSEILLSIDLEDVRDLVPDGSRLRERVPAMVDRLLAYLHEARARVTFFTTGPVCVRYKSLMCEIISAGHEVASHSFAHKPLDEYFPQEFDDDLQKSIDALRTAGANVVEGFRAPVVSMTERTAWVYRLLARRGIVYSSSVLPATNPLYGWADFGNKARSIEGVLEIPVSVGRILGRDVPFASGVYFRVLPGFLIRRELVRASRSGQPITSYLHPYDFDPEQESFTIPRLGRNPVYHFLMHYGRATAFDKLQMLLSLGLRVSTYGQFWRQVTANGGTKG
jgi:polysaccharide deacetylase family protein (PEP-CTERM system associated)